MHLSITLLIMMVFARPAFASSTVYSKNKETKEQIKYDFYSETLSSVLFSGVTTQSRLRLVYPVRNTKISFYAGINTSNDLTTGTSLKYADDFVSPTFGALLKPFNFLGLFAEYRRLIRTETIESLDSSENDSRIGAYVYKKYALYSSRYKPFIETYAETVALTRFSSKPVTTAWLKAGSEHQISKKLTLAAYLEAFIRDSPSLLIGVTDQNINAGARLKWSHKQFSAQILAYNRIHTKEVPEGWEGLLVLSAHGGLL